MAAAARLAFDAAVVVFLVLCAKRLEPGDALWVYAVVLLAVMAALLAAALVAGLRATAATLDGAKRTA